MLYSFFLFLITMFLSAYRLVQNVNCYPNLSNSNMCRYIQYMQNNRNKLCQAFV